jgi:hypothetical protein
VVLARGLNPIPFRTRPLNPSAPMVLRLKTRESRSLPGLQSTANPFTRSNLLNTTSAKPTADRHEKPGTKAGHKPPDTPRHAALPQRPNAPSLDRADGRFRASASPSRPARKDDATRAPSETGPSRQNAGMASSFLLRQDVVRDGTLFGVAAARRLRPAMRTTGPHTAPDPTRPAPTTASRRDP